MIQHVVLLKFPQSLEPTEEKELRTQIESWPSEIAELRRIRFGPSIFDQWTDGYQYLLYLELEDLDAVNRYLTHPVHRAFGEWLAEHGATFLVFNYALDGTTQVLP